MRPCVCTVIAQPHGLLEINNNNRADYFFRLNVYIDVENGEREKTKEINFVRRKTWKFYRDGEKMRNASAQQGESEA